MSKRRQPFDDEEAPTRPDGPQPCPQCAGTGEVRPYIETGTIHRTLPPETCRLCKGKGTVGRATLDRFRALATDRPPPPEAKAPPSPLPPKPPPGRKPRR